MNKVLSKDPSSIVNSVLFLLIGIILFANPNGIVSLIAYLIGIVVIIIGAFRIFNATKSKNTPNYNAKLTIGILCIVIGIVLMFCGPIIEIVFRFFIGGWILIGGINKLVIAINMKDKSNDWIKVLIVSILLLIIGLYVILKSNLVFSSIGLIMIIYSVISIVGYFMTPKQKNKDII